MLQGLPPNIWPVFLPDMKNHTMANLLFRFESYGKSLKHPEEENLFLWKAVHLQERPLGRYFDWCKDISQMKSNVIFNGPKAFFSN